MDHLDLVAVPINEGSYFVLRRQDLGRLEPRFDVTHSRPASMQDVARFNKAIAVGFDDGHLILVRPR